MASVFFEPGTDATGDFSFWSSTTGTVTSDTTTKYTGPRSIKVDSGAGNAAAYVQKNDILADAGRRITFRLYLESIPTTTFRCLNLVNSGASPCGGISIDTAGLVRVIAGGTGVSTGVTLSTGQWYRLAFSYTITSPTEAQAKLAINGGAQATSNSVTHNTGSVHLRLGLTQVPGANIVGYVDDVYVDDGSDNTALGDIQVTAKAPASENTNNFDTAVGNARGASDYNNVNEVALSETNGWQHAGVTDVQENYGLQTASDTSNGSADLTTATLIARTAWLWGKRSATPTISVPAVGAEGSAGSGDITLGAPDSPAVGDIWIAAIHSSDQVAHSFSDWTEIIQGNGGGTTSRLSVWYFRYAGSNPNLVVTHTDGQSPIGGIVVVRGCKLTGSPVNVVGTIGQGTDGSIEHPAVTPTTTGCVLLVINGSADDNARTALGGGYTVDFEDSGGGTQNCFQTTAGTPDGSVSVFHDLDVAASDTGIITVTQAATDAWASVLLALEPDTVGSPDIMDNGSESAIVLVETSALYTVTTDSASYPSNAAGIGMRSSGTGTDTFLYECGTIISYIAGAAQAAAVVVKRKLRMFRGLGR
jgi:hypothetical protein